MPNIAFPVVTSCWRIKNTLQSSPIELRPRQSSAKVIDTFAFGSAYEMEEFLLRMYEMGEEVSEFHIVKGDRDFFGRQKPYEFEAILNSGQLDAWKDKITCHKAEIPMAVRGHNIQEAQRQAMRSQTHRDYNQTSFWKGIWTRS